MKKIVALLLVLCMVIGLVACGNNNTNNDPKPDVTDGADVSDGKVTDAAKDPDPTKAPDNSDDKEPTQSADPQGGEDSEPEPTPEAMAVIEWDLDKKEYVFKDSVSTLATYWNPHDYETEDDSYMKEFIEAGFYNFVFNDEIHEVEGKEAYEGYKIIPEMAESLPVDVTEKIKADHPEFNIPESAKKGYAYTIDLNKNACWEDGTPINADSYVYSMQKLLDPKLINYRATDYYAQDLSIAGAENYFFSGRTVKNVNSLDGSAMTYQVSDLVKGEDGTYKSPDGTDAFFGLKEGYQWMGGDSLTAYQEAGYIPAEGCWDILSAAADADGFVPVTDETMNALFTFTNSDTWGNEPWEQLGYYMSFTKSYPEVGFETVGILKTGDYQITLVFTKALSGFNLLYSLTSNWLVYQPYYDKCLTETNGTWTSSYGTSVETTMSYGPYKLVSYQTDKALRLERNPKWYGYTDNLHVYVDPVDGETYRMYQTDAIDCQVIAESATRKMMFLKGELMNYGLQAEDFDAYRNSEFVHVVPSETLYFFIFNGFKKAIDEREAAADFDTAKYDLQTMTLLNFRKAIAVTYDKELLCASVSPARSGGYGLLGVGYIYDPDTGARYRDTDQAKQVLCDFYSVDVSKYANLDEAVASITGYDPVKAKELFGQAFQDSLAAGFITDADNDGKSDQMIRIEYSSSSTSDFIVKTLDYLNKKLAEVLVGTPFEGKIEFYESAPYGNEWSTKIKNGLSDTVLAGWTGSALNPYSITSAYTNPAQQYDAKWFDSTTVSMTLNVDTAGIDAATPKMEDVTLTLKEWSDILNGETVEKDGKSYCFGDGIAKVDTRLSILAAIEGTVLQTYDYIPMLQNAGMSLLTQQAFYVVDEYNAIMGRGGVPYLKYNYNETDWKQYVSDNGGELSY